MSRKVSGHFVLCNFNYCLFNHPNLQPTIGNFKKMEGREHHVKRRKFSKKWLSTDEKIIRDKLVSFRFLMYYSVKESKGNLLTSLNASFVTIVIDRVKHVGKIMSPSFLAELLERKTSSQRR